MPRTGDDIVHGIDSSMILPDAPRIGLVINVAERRMYYYPGTSYETRSKYVYVYHFLIGDQECQFPKSKLKTIIDDKLGGNNQKSNKYAIGLKHGGLYITSSSFKRGSYHDSSDRAGCIILSDRDMSELYALTQVGSPVHLVDQPVKIGYELSSKRTEPLIEIAQGSYERLGRNNVISLAYALVGQHVAIQSPISMSAVDKALYNPSSKPVPITHDSNGDYGDNLQSRKSNGNHASSSSNPRDSVVRIDAGPFVGSGFFLGKNLVVTNAHVVAERK